MHAASLDTNCLPFARRPTAAEQPVVLARAGQRQVDLECLAAPDAAQQRAALDEAADSAGDRSAAAAATSGGHADRLVSLIFWYKDENPAPVYTLDARRPLVAEQVAAAAPTSDALNLRLLAAARHYSAGAHLSVRLDSWPLLKLRISRVSKAHAGEYKCRVDFRRARTIRRSTKLLVEGKFV